MATKRPPTKKQGGKGKPFPKGKSGNPGGRPKYAKISEAVRMLLTLPAAEFDTYQPATMAEKLAWLQIKEGTKKKPVRSSAQFVADRAEGLPMASVKVSGDVTGSGVAVDMLKPPEGFDPAAE